MRISSGGVERAGIRLASHGAMALYRQLVPRRSLGLCYHVVSDAHLPHVKHLYDYKTAEQFERDLLWLQRHFRIVSYDELVAGRERGGRNGAPSVFLSFDDGVAECYSVARPLLLRHGVPCTFFLTSGFLDNQRLFYRHKVSLCIDAALRLGPGECAPVLAEVRSRLGVQPADVDALIAWTDSLGFHDQPAIDELCSLLHVDVEEYLRNRRPYLTRGEARQLAADGFTLGGHTVHHPPLEALGTRDEVAREIVESCRVAAELSGRARVPFAFPFGAGGVDRASLRELRASQPVVDLLFDIKGIGDDAVEFMHNRVGADPPPVAGARRSNLPVLLGSAYLVELRSRLSGWRRRVRGPKWA